MPTMEGAVMVENRKSQVWLMVAVVSLVLCAGIIVAIVVSTGSDQSVQVSASDTSDSVVSTTVSPVDSTLPPTTSVQTPTSTTIIGQDQLAQIYRQILDDIYYQNNIALTNVNNYFSLSPHDPASEEFRLNANRAMSRCSELLEQYNTAIFDSTASWLHAHNLPATNEISCVWWD